TNAARATVRSARRGSSSLAAAVFLPRIDGRRSCGFGALSRRDEDRIGVDRSGNADLDALASECPLDGGPPRFASPALASLPGGSLTGPCPLPDASGNPARGVAGLVPRQYGRSLDRRGVSPCDQPGRAPVRNRAERRPVRPVRRA